MSEKSFEALYQELDDLVKAMEGNQMPLEQSIKAYEKGLKLQKQCQEKLAQAALKLEKL